MVAIFPLLLTAIGVILLLRRVFGRRRAPAAQARLLKMTMAPDIIAADHALKPKPYVPDPAHIKAMVDLALAKAEREAATTERKNAAKPITRALLVKLATEKLSPATVRALAALELPAGAPGYIPHVNVRALQPVHGGYATSCPHCKKPLAFTADWVMENDLLSCHHCGRRIQLYRTILEKLSRAGKADRERMARLATRLQPPPDDIHDEAPTPKTTPRGKTYTLATGFHFPVHFIYAGGSHPGAGRNVTLHSAAGHVEPDGGYDVITVSGTCETAQAWRAFRLDRIHDLIDLETGEVIADPRAWITRKLNHVT